MKSKYLRRRIEIDFGNLKSPKLLIKVMQSPIVRCQRRKKDGREVKYNYFYFVVDFDGREQQRFAQSLEERDLLINKVITDFLATGSYVFHSVADNVKRKEVLV